MPVSLPPLNKLPRGPKRDLVVALHELYDAAGRPSARKVADAAEETEGELRDKVSHSTFLLVMRGELIPSWSKVEVVVLVLARRSARGHDPKDAAARLHELWLNCTYASEPGDQLDDVAETLEQLPPELGAAYRTLASDLGFLRRDTWEELDEARRLDLVTYLCRKLESGDDPLTALRVAHNLNGNLSRRERTDVCQSALFLRRNESVEVRRKLAWDLRWMYSMETRDFLYEGLCEMLDDSDEEVVDSAHGSLGFVLEGDVSETLWRRIDERTTDFYVNANPRLKDAALFMYYKLLESDFGRLDHRIARERINEAMLSGEIPLQERALFAMTELIPRLSPAEAVLQFERTLALIETAPAQVQQKVLDFWRVVFFPSTGSFHRKKITPEVALELSGLVIDKVIACLNSDYPEVRDMAKSTLEQMGYVLPRSRHSQVLNALAGLVRIDRGIGLDRVARIVNEYVGEIPPELSELLRTHNEKKIAEEDDGEDWDS